MAESSTIWPSRFPRAAFFYGALALLAGAGMFKFWSHSHRAEVFYLGQYLQTSVVLQDSDKPFAVLLPDGSSQVQSLDASAHHLWIEKKIYHSQPLYQVAAWPLSITGILLLVGLIVGGRQDSKRNKKVLNEGRHLSGPRLVSRAEFNRLAEVK